MKHYSSNPSRISDWNQLMENYQVQSLITKAKDDIKYSLKMNNSLKSSKELSNLFLQKLKLPSIISHKHLLSLMQHKNRNIDHITDQIFSLIQPIHNVNLGQLNGNRGCMIEGHSISINIRDKPVKQPFNEIVKSIKNNKIRALVSSSLSATTPLIYIDQQPIYFV